MKQLFVVLVVCQGLIACTGGGTSPKGPTPILPIGEATPDSVQKEIADLQKTLNEDPEYALGSEELVFLEAEGLVTDNELEGWVN